VSVQSFLLDIHRPPVCEHFGYPCMTLAVNFELANRQD